MTPWWQFSQHSRCEVFSSGIPPSGNYGKRWVSKAVKGLIGLDSPTTAVYQAASLEDQEHSRIMNDGPAPKIVRFTYIYFNNSTTGNRMCQAHLGLFSCSLLDAFSNLQSRWIVSLPPVLTLWNLRHTIFKLIRPLPCCMVSLLMRRGVCCVTFRCNVGTQINLILGAQKVWCYASWWVLVAPKNVYSPYFWNERKVSFLL